MQAPWKRAASITVAACVATALIGCKRPVEQADRSVNQQLADAGKQLPGQPDKAIPVFQKAATVAGASHVAQAQAHRDLADARVRAADHLILGLTPASAKTKTPSADGVEQIEAEIVSLCTAINQQTARIQANNVVMAGYKQLEPKAAQEALTKGTSAAEGGQDAAPWISADSGAIPSVAAVDAQVTALTEKITALETRKKELDAQRLTAVQQAEQLRNQSEATTGHKSVELFTQSSNLRKQAADLTAQMDVLDAQLATLNQDLRLAKAQKEQLAKAVKALKGQTAQVAINWKAIQEQIQARGQASQALLGGAGAPAVAAPADATTAPADATTAPVTPAPLTPATGPAGATAAATTEPAATPSDITGLSDAIAALSAKADALRDKAAAHLNDALKDYEQVAKSNKVIATEYTEKLNKPDIRGYPQSGAWQMLIEIHNPSDVKLQEAGAWLRLARIYADWAHTLAVQDDAAKTLKKTVDAGNTLLAGTDLKLAAPASLNADTLDKTMADAKSRAEEAYDKADKLLQEVITAPATNPLTKSARDAARTVQLVAYYGRSQFDSAVGDSSNSGKWLSESKRTRDTMTADNIPLPSPMPVEISLAPTVSSTFETTPPATGPSTAPTTLPTTTAPTTGPTTDTTTFGNTIDTRPNATPPAPPSTDTPPATGPSTAPAATPDTAPASPTPPAATPPAQ